MIPELTDERHTLTLLMARLERISVDSYWAHRASGVRGALLRAQERMDAGRPITPRHLQSLIQQGFYILEQAAREKSGG